MCYAHYYVEISDFIGIFIWLLCLPSMATPRAPAEEAKPHAYTARGPGGVQGIPGRGPPTTAAAGIPIS